MREFVLFIKDFFFLPMPEVDIILAELGIKLMRFCIKASKNLSTFSLNICDMYAIVIHASRTT